MEMDPWQLIVLLGAFAVVAALAMPRRKDSDNAANAAGMQVALEQFMENMEADNRELVDTLTKSQHQHREDNAARDARIVGLERRILELEEKLERSELRFEEQLRSVRTAAVQPSAASEPAAIANAAPDTTAQPAAETDRSAADQAASPIRERYAEVFDMHGQGKSIDAIAKKLGMNKGEVMLILQLARQEEERRV